MLCTMANLDQELKTEQLVVQVTPSDRARLTALRNAYQRDSGSLPSEAEAIRRLMYRGFPALFSLLNSSDPADLATSTEG